VGQGKEENGLSQAHQREFITEDCGAMENVREVIRTKIHRQGRQAAGLNVAGQTQRLSSDKKDKIFISMRKVWERMPFVGDSTKIVEEDRNAR
jgi:DNA-binding IclR family transcriptional regulator